MPRMVVIVVLALAGCEGSKAAPTETIIWIDEPGLWSMIPIEVTVAGAPVVVRDKSLRLCAECPQVGQRTFLMPPGKTRADVVIRHAGPCAARDLPLTWSTDVRVKLPDDEPEIGLTTVIDNRGGSQVTVRIGAATVVAPPGVTQATLHDWSCGELPVSIDGAAVGTIAKREYSLDTALIDVSGRHCYRIAQHEYSMNGLAPPGSVQYGPWELRDKRLHQWRMFEFVFEPAPATVNLPGTYFSLADC